MRRDRFYIGIAIFMVIVAAVFFTVYLMGQQKRNDAIRELEHRVAEIKSRSHRNSNTDTTTSNRHGATATEKDNNAAHDNLAKVMISLTKSKKWEQFIESLVRIDGGEDTEEDTQQIPSFLEENQKLIDQLRRLAGTDYIPSKKTLTVFSHYTRLLATNMAISAQQGDYETAFLDFRTAKTLADTIRNNPELMSKLVGRLMYSILYKCIETNIRVEHLSSDQFNELIAFSTEAANRERIADALLVMHIEEDMELFNAVRNGDRGLTPLYRFYATVGRPLLDMDAGRYADIMNQAFVAIRRPFYEARPILEELQRAGGSTFLNPITSVTVSSLTRHPEQQAFHEAQMGLMQVGLAVEQYHLQHGEYPQALEAISPALGGTLPLDPYTGQNFVYKPDDDNFTLYSARGSVITPGEYLHPLMDSNGNIIWRHTEK